MHHSPVYRRINKSLYVALVLTFALLLVHFFLIIHNMNNIGQQEKTVFEDEELLDTWNKTALTIAMHPDLRGAAPANWQALLNRADTLVSHLYKRPHSVMHKAYFIINANTIRRIKHLYKTDTPPKLKKNSMDDIHALMDVSRQHILNEQKHLAELHNSLQKLNFIFLVAIFLLLHLILVFVIRPVVRKIDADYHQMKTERDEAVAANNAKSRYLSTMSHVIRTPLNGVLAMTDLLLETELTSEQKDYLKIVQAGGKNLLTVISDILDFSRIESNLLELIEIDFNIRQLVEQLADEFHDEVGDKDIALIVFIEPNVATHIMGDPKRISQILTNLVTNAIKFTRKGEIIIRVSMQRVTDEKDEILFAVSDTGMGIPEEKQSGLFVPFKESSNNLEKSFEGTGLGLALSARLVELMGGHIWVESEINKGSTFYFTVPLKQSTQTKVKKSESAPEITDKKTKIQRIEKGHKPDILLVEDNIINQRLMIRLMERLGYEIDVAEDGRVAVQMAAEKSYDIIFMDLQMPEMDGIEATREILNNSGASQPNIIAMTANVSIKNRTLCLDAGMVDYVAKPVSLDKIKDILKKFETV